MKDLRDGRWKAHVRLLVHGLRPKYWKPVYHFYRYEWDHRRCDQTDFHHMLGCPVTHPEEFPNVKMPEHDSDRFMILFAMLAAVVGVAVFILYEVL